MKVALVYPPFKKKGAYPLLSQNRQFKYSKSQEVRIYPVIMATLATRLKNLGHEVLFLDGINKRLTMKQFEDILFDFSPDIAVMETKAPIVYEHWDYIVRLKKLCPNTKTILTGDHVTFFPEESMSSSRTDFVAVGGNYDYTITSLVESIGNDDEIPLGFYYRKDGESIFSGEAGEFDLSDTPVIDRDLTSWQDYGEAYLYRPVAYILSGRGCGRAEGGAGVCTFCIWQHSFWRCKASLRPAKNVVGEIKHLVENYGVKEVFDDNEGGFIYDYDYTKEFYEEMERERLIGKVKISMNARADSLTNEMCLLLKKIGVRLLKIGVESGNDETLKRIHKLETAQEIEEGIMRAKRFGMRVLLTNMVGYPWESEKEVAYSYDRLKKLMFYKTRFGDSLQASIVVAYPGTPLHKEAVTNNWLNVSADNYRNYDMTEDILKSPIDTTEWCRRYWAIQTHPLFLIRSFLSIRTFEDIKLALRGIRSLIGHLRDY